MLDFYKTQGGRRFLDGTVPRLIDAVVRLAQAVEKNNELHERELALQVPEVPSPKIQTCDVEGCSNAAEMCCNECDVVVCSDHWESADEAGCHCHPEVKCSWCHKEPATVGGLCDECWDNRNERGVGHGYEKQ